MKIVSGIFRFKDQIEEKVDQFKLKNEKPVYNYIIWSPRTGFISRRQEVEYK